MQNLINTVVQWIIIYDLETGKPNYFMSLIGFFVFCVVLYFILEIFALIKSATNSITK